MPEAPVVAKWPPGTGGQGHPGRWLLAPQPSLQKHPLAGTAGPSVKPGSEALIPSLPSQLLAGVGCLWWFFLIPGPADQAGRPARPAAELAPPAPCHGAGTAQSRLGAAGEPRGVASLWAGRTHSG